MTELKRTYPAYYISKNRIDLQAETNVEKVLDTLKAKYSNEKITDIDGVKIDFADGWVHLRKSNTEPIIRVYSESKDENSANQLANEVIKTFYSACQ